MNDKRLTLTSAVALAVALLIQSPITSARAQSTDRDNQQKEIAEAKEILRRLRTGELPKRDELDVLERVIAALEKPVSSEAAAQKTAGRSTPAPDQSAARGSRPAAAPAVGLSRHSTKDGPVYLYVVDLGTSVLRSFWLDRRNRPYSSISRLDAEQSRAGYRLQFAINGGIFDQGRRPQGLYIEDSRVLSELDTATPGNDAGNFYLEPNGVFLLDAQNNARIVTTPRFVEQFPSSRSRASIRFAVQSGPTLLVDGTINPQFAEESTNKKRRTGVGILDRRRVVFGMSGGDVSFHDFAALFAKLGCRDALYLDGGEIGALYSRSDKLAVGMDSLLVTMFGVIEKASDRSSAGQ